MRPKEAKEKSNGAGFMNAYNYIENKSARSKHGVFYWEVLRTLVNGLEKDGYKVTIEKQQGVN